MLTAQAPKVRVLPQFSKMVCVSPLPGLYASTMKQPDPKPPKPDDVLRRMLQTPPRPKRGSPKNPVGRLPKK